MAGTKLSKEMKEAISRLNDKEKDKLLFRLISKDPKLVNKLEFQLIEGSETTEERREKLMELIDRELAAYPMRFYSCGYLMMHLRDLSGKINEHVRITGDRYGELQLNYLMLNRTLQSNKLPLKDVHYRDSFKLFEYIVKRILKLYSLLGKLHEDYVLEFEDDLSALGGHISEIENLENSAIHHGLDVNWLINGSLPDA